MQLVYPQRSWRLEYLHPKEKVRENQGNSGAQAQDRPHLHIYKSILHILRWEATRWAGGEQRARTAHRHTETFEFRPCWLKAATVQAPMRNISEKVDWDFMAEPVITTG